MNFREAIERTCDYCNVLKRVYGLDVLENLHPMMKKLPSGCWICVTCAHDKRIGLIAAQQRDKYNRRIPIRKEPKVAESYSPRA